MELKLHNYSVYTTYKNKTADKLHISCCDFNYTFNEGVYYFIGEIVSGGPAIAYSLTPDSKTNISENSIIDLNGNILNLKEIKKTSCYLNHYSILNGIFNCKTVLKIVSLNKKVNIKDILKKFSFPEWLLERKVSQLGQYTELFWAIYFYIKEKKIFVFPWISKYNMNLSILENIIDILKNEECIILVPISKDLVDKTKFNGNVIEF